MSGNPWSNHVVPYFFEISIPQYPTTQIYILSAGKLTPFSPTCICFSMWGVKDFHNFCEGLPLRLSEDYHNLQNALFWLIMHAFTERWLAIKCLSCYKILSCSNTKSCEYIREHMMFTKFKISSFTFFLFKIRQK